MGAFAYTLGVSGNQADVATMLNDYYTSGGNISTYPPGLEWADGASPASTPQPYCASVGCAPPDPGLDLMSSASGAAIAAGLFPSAASLTGSVPTIYARYAVPWGAGASGIATLSSTALTSAFGFSPTLNNNVVGSSCAPNGATVANQYGNGQLLLCVSGTWTAVGGALSATALTSAFGFSPTLNNNVAGSSCSPNGSTVPNQYGGGQLLLCVSGLWVAITGNGYPATAPSSGNYTFGGAVTVTPNGDVNLGAGSFSTTVGTIITHTGEYYEGPHATAPTGSCGLNGMWAFSQDGHGSWCSNGTWVEKF